jgi:hypothetical protein
MPARTQPYAGDLVVTFERDGEPPESMIARDPERAWAHAILLITQRSNLIHGDTLTVRRTDEAQPATVLRGPGGGQ